MATDSDTTHGVSGGGENPLYQLFRHYGRDYWPVFAFGLVASILQVGLSRLPALVTGVAFDALFFGTVAYDLPLVPRSWIPDGRMSQFWFTVAVLAGTYLFVVLISTVGVLATQWFTKRLLHDVRTDTYDAMQRLSLRYFDGEDTGEIISILNNDVRNLQTFTSGTLVTLIVFPISVAIAFAYMALLNWQLAVVLLFAPVLIAAVSYWYANKVAPVYDTLRERIGSLNAQLEHNISGIATIKAYTAEDEELERVDGHIEATDVTFAYDDEPVLRGVSLEAAPGETVGIVGSTGAGKSTFTKLLLRFYDVDEGSISVDGHDVRDVTLRSLRESIGYVAQEPYLFSGTVRENIAYGTSEASNRTSGEPVSEGATDGEVREAAKAAQAHAFITRLEDGYDTQVGERGAKLSGGQRQRIAIARALVREPPILLFDEATSHVDNETEVLIQHSLAEITEDRTTFVVAHRLSTVRNADTILVLEDGNVIERGSHEELLEADGVYATLWGVQVGRTDLSAELVDDPSGGRG